MLDSYGHTLFPAASLETEFLYLGIHDWFEVGSTF